MQIDYKERTPRRPWNVGAKAPLKPKHIWSMRALLSADGEMRELAMLKLAVDSKLRDSDLVWLNITDLVVGGHVKSRATIVQKKTGTPVPVELTDATRESALVCARQPMPREGPRLFPSRSHAGRPMTTRQYARLVDQWIGLIGLKPADYGTHSLRRAEVALVYRQRGNIHACQSLLGQTKIESTVRYLRVDVALNMSKRTEI